MLLAKQISRVTLFLVLVCYLTPSKAQINSPFSRYGLGNEVLNGQNATSQAMGGFSSAFNSTMSGSYGQSVNFNNPASYSQHYMTTFDIAMSLNQTTLKRTDPAAREKSAYLVPNYLAIGVPISKEKKIGFAFGLQPLTSIKYSVNEITNFNGVDTLLNNYRGDGGLNQVFVGVAKGWKYLSIGLNTGYNFGRKDIETYKSISYIPDSSFFYQSKSSTKTSYAGAFLKLGVQGEFPIYTIDRPATKEKTEYTISYGATYTLDQTLKARQDLTRTIGTYTANTETPVDTALSVTNQKGNITLPSFSSIGFALHKKQVVARGSYDQWVFGMELNQAAWKDSYTFYGKKDPLSNSYMIRGGIQYNPDPYAFENYWSTVIYRAGFFSGKDYVNIDNNGLKITGLTLGLGLPIRKYRSYDYQFTILNLALQIGQRGSSVNNFKESFLQFTLGYSLSDVWFNKRKYD
jgi:hypothetical protein